MNECCSSVAIFSFSFISVCVLVCRSWGRGSCGGSTVFLSTCPQTVKTCWRNYSCSTLSNEAAWRYYRRLHWYNQKCFCSRADSPKDLELCIIWKYIIAAVVNCKLTEHFSLQCCQMEILNHYSSEIKQRSYIMLWWKHLEIMKLNLLKPCKEYNLINSSNPYVLHFHCIHIIRVVVGLFLLCKHYVVVSSIHTRSVQSQ